jgi:AcrR family transcriptional regulator
MRKREDITAITKQNLIDAFWALYCHKRIEDITVKEIAKNAGYNRGTFYEYFTGVHAVLTAIEKSLVPSLDQLPPIATSSGSIGMPIDVFLKTFEQNGRYYSVLLGDHGDPAFAGMLKDSIKPNILKLLADKPGINSIDLDYILEYTLSAMIGLMSYWLKQEEAPASDRLFELVHRLMKDGIASTIALLDL